MIDKYYQILGVSRNASLDEIKKVFRKKAREYHPDVNKSPNAHEQFILLNEAYQYLQNKYTHKSYNDFTKSYQSSRSYTTYEDFAARDREAARKRAEYYAKRKYQRFKKSAYYKRSLELQMMADQVAILFVALFIMGLLVGGVLLGVYAFFASLFLIAVSSPSWLGILQSSGKFNYDMMVKGVIYLVRHPITQMILLIAFSIIIFFSVILKTLISFSDLGIIYSVSLIVFIILTLTVKKAFSLRKKYLYVFGISHGLISLFFLLNFLTSSVKGNHYYIMIFERSRAGYIVQDPEEIFLSSEELLSYELYEALWGIRAFMRFGEIKRASNNILFRIEEGGLGVQVVAGYEFVK